MPATDPASLTCSNPKEHIMDEINTTSATEETWEAWLDGKRGEAVQFEVPTAGTCDVTEAGARAIGIDVCEELNVARATGLI